MRTPYDKSQELALTEKDYFPPRGYVLVVQDTRGRFSSEGEFYPFIHEATTATTPSNGPRRCHGPMAWLAPSANRISGWCSTMPRPTRPPHLKAMCPVSGPVTYFENCVYRRGVFELGWMLTYFTFMARNTLARKGIYRSQKGQPRQLSRASRHSALAAQGRGISSSADFRLGRAARQGRALLRRLSQALERRTVLGGDRLATIVRTSTAPVIHVGSWYDAFQYDTLAMYTAMRRHARSDKARRGQRLLMGPWAHLLPYAIPTSRGTGDIEFGPRRKSNCTRSNCDGSITG